ncbi:hypothetical protein EIP91_004406 [Steccherinum ochraceum]|uniref:RlpA-like protein double-psi beta-barrel domain-containing protein n=1 Tax=Steccherinum ochraceum TaxID=92696 RepID=A0A4R0RUG5_9APHY|nr:hypothetical protein EIP91_004406 [Steccherinum ochraceum]
MLALLAIFFAALLAFCRASPIPGDAILQKRAYTGKATFYSVGLGACGQQNVDTDPVVSIPIGLFGNAYPSPDCNKRVTITNTANGRVAHGTVLDECPTCGPSDLDLSKLLFLQLADNLGEGLVPVTWSFDS